ncbi:hypothetical protein LJC68_08085 [Bacteroidales bacterium OttesenSCG-928-B11]|nr:hypothetical protein [Bacteroidales bacterium OttesenSCG-928-B11]MDL2326480.1 hypothetical protein [Bacteroidales bacterium OttesenSCG-928-A14]
MRKQGFHIFSFVLLFCLLPTILQAQKNPFSYQPFKGFHLGVTGQMELVEKMDFTPIFGKEYTPVPSNGIGWEAGIEISYHFAKYFGVSLGINKGTVRSGKFKIFVPYSEFWNGYTDEYDKMVSSSYEILIPIQFEFHYPIARNFYFTTNVGVKIKNYPYFFEKDFPFAYSLTSAVIDDNDEMKVVFDMYSTGDLAKVEFDLIFSTGIYYRLPYADFLRLTIGANFALNKYTSGIYEHIYSFGTFSIRNNFLFLQFSYVHSFDFEKMKKKVKKNLPPFPSKKERRNYILDQLK